MMANLDEMRDWVTSAFPDGKWENPQKTNWLIHSLHREDKHPSLSIDIEKRCTYDRATGESLKLSEFCQMEGIEEPEWRNNDNSFSRGDYQAPAAVDKNAILANDLWKKAQPAPEGFPYLQRKQVSSDGLKTALDQSLGQVILVPAYDLNGQIVGLERIAADGTKRHLGSKTGSFFLIGDPQKGKPIYVCEGLSTADSVHRLTGQATAHCFGANNLLTVARVLQKKYKTDAVVCPDADTAGRTTADKALSEGLKVVMMPEGSPDKQDWNDLFCKDGLDKTQELFREQEQNCPARVEKKEFSKESVLLSFRRHIEPERGFKPEMIGGIFPRGGVSVLAGQQGSGKSLLMQKFCCDVSLGGSILDGFSEITSDKKILYFVGEFSVDSMNDRQRTANWQQKAENLILYSLKDLQKSEIPINLDGDEGFSNIRLLVESEKPDLVIIDSLMSFLGCDESDMQQMQAGFARLIRLADEGRCAVVVVHHIRKRKTLERSLRLHMDDIIGSSIITRNASVAVGAEKIMLDGSESVYVASLKTWYAPIEEFSFKFIQDKFKVFRGLEFDLNPKNPVANKTESIEHAVFKTYGDGTDFTVSDIIEETGASKSMIKKALLEWKKDKRIKSTGKGRNISYSIMQNWLIPLLTQSQTESPSATPVADKSRWDKPIKSKSANQPMVVSDGEPVAPRVNDRISHNPMTLAEAEKQVSEAKPEKAKVKTEPEESSPCGDVDLNEVWLTLQKYDPETARAWLDGNTEAKELYQEKFDRLHKTIKDEALCRDKALERTWEHFKQKEVA